MNKFEHVRGRGRTRVGRGGFVQLGPGGRPRGSLYLVQESPVGAGVGLGQGVPVLCVSMHHRYWST